MNIKALTVLASVFLSACGGATMTPAPKPVTSPKTPVAYMANPEALFSTVAKRVVPLAVTACREATTNTRCDFSVFVDNRYPEVVNAYQTQDRSGKPYIVFSVGLLNTARNEDELAFVLGHELAHHLAGHLQRQATSSQLGAILAGGVAAMMGGSNQTVEAVTRIGADVGARAYSKSHELEADKLGTLLALDAGYDPFKGAQFFTRIPDPGDTFLGTHPPNTARIDMVRSTMASVRK